MYGIFDHRKGREGRGEQVRFYLHEFYDLPVRVKWEYDKFFYNRWCQEAHATLTSHPNRVVNESDADIFVIPQSLRTVSFVGFPWLQYLRSHLETKTSWLSRKKHVMFDITDSPHPFVDHPNIIICKTAFYQTHFDPTKHIPIPQFPRERFIEEIKPSTERKHLIGFKGHPRASYTDLRTRLFKLHDGEKVIIESGEYSPGTIEPYYNMLRNSKFALLPRANGYALSYRMIEVMNLGCIPVILSDGHVLPFGSELDYDSFSVKVLEKDAEMLIDILESQTNLKELQKNALEVYSEYFSSTEKIINHTMRMVGELNVKG